MKNIILAFVAILLTILSAVGVISTLFIGFIALMRWVNPVEAYYPYSALIKEPEHYAFWFLVIALLTAVEIIVTFFAWVTLIDSVEDDQKKNN